MNGEKSYSNFNQLTAAKMNGATLQVFAFGEQLVYHNFDVFRNTAIF